MEDSVHEVSLSSEELTTWSKKNLQHWLSKRGLKKSGNKSTLVNRIIRTINFGESDISSDTDSSDEENNFTNLPNIKELEKWDELTTSNSPPVRVEDVHNYFLFEKNPVTGRTKHCNRQLQKSKKFSNENYIGDIQYNSVDSTSLYCVVRAKCKPSMRQKVAVTDGKVRSYYSLSVTLTKQTGKIICATCDCKAGLSGVCSHVGGLLLTVVKVRTSCTSTGCTWLEPNASLTRPLSPKRIADINFETDSTKDHAIKPFPNVYQAGPGKDPCSFFNDILKGLKLANPSSVLYRTMCASSGNIDEILSVYKPSYMYSNSVDLSSTVCQTEFREFTNNLNISDKQSESVNIATRGQSNNKNWKTMRSYLLTASNFGMVCRRQEKTPADNLIKQLRGYKPIPEGVPSLQHGRRYENTARRAYIKEHVTKCSGEVEVKDMGVYVSQQFPFLGASVDGLITCSVCGSGALEIKCPYGKNSDKWRHKTPTECAKNKSFCCEFNLSGELSLKHNHQYYYQVIGQMAVLELTWADFVIWTKKGISVERITFDENFWQSNMLFKLKDFYCHDFVAELFTERVKRGFHLYK
ncbi:uncharacterized protein LOC117343858 [Pecten maximus]|uniref:uncharacterized protein LOC117343858 n=1 Tax=Pecten maximus TaxID=6579 RepID=UPI0014581CA7|nr:uncharacterized protein LOC117343858 [Pecten maximus]